MIHAPQGSRKKIHDSAEEVGDGCNRQDLKACFDNGKPEIVLHLAAQPIVRDSYKEPRYTYEPTSWVR